MNSRHALRSLISGALLAMRRCRRRSRKAPSIFPPARISIRKNCSGSANFSATRSPTGKIPGAIVLIQQHGKPVYHEFFGVRDVATSCR